MSVREGALLGKWYKKIKNRGLSYIESYLPDFPLFIAITYACNQNCNYCQASNLRDNYHIDKDSFKLVLQWAKKNDYKSILFTGGEPTLHPDFKVFCKKVKEEGLRVYVTTNGSFCDSSYLENVDCVFFNVSASTKLSHISKIIQETNHKITFIYRVNINSNTSSEFLNKVKQDAFSQKVRIRAGITTDPLFAEKRVQNLSEIKANIARLISFCSDCSDSGIYTYLARPIPRCFFSSDQWRKMRVFNVKTKCFVGHKGNYASRIVVNPDLSLYGCFSNGFKIANLLDHGKKDIINFLRKNHAKAVEKGCFLMGETDCKYFRSNECFGVCYAFFDDK